MFHEPLDGVCQEQSVRRNFRATANDSQWSPAGYLGHTATWEVPAHELGEFAVLAWLHAYRSAIPRRERLS